MNILGFTIKRQKVLLTKDLARKKTIQSQFQDALRRIYENSSRGNFLCIVGKSDLCNESIILLNQRGFDKIELSKTGDSYIISW